MAREQLRGELPSCLSCPTRAQRYECNCTRCYKPLFPAGYFSCLKNRVTVYLKALHMLVGDRKSLTLIREKNHRGAWRVRQPVVIIPRLSKHTSLQFDSNHLAPTSMPTYVTDCRRLVMLGYNSLCMMSHDVNFGFCISRLRYGNAPTVTYCMTSLPSMDLSKLFFISTRSGLSCTFPSLPFPEALSRDLQCGCSADALAMLRAVLGR